MGRIVETCLYGRITKINTDNRPKTFRMLLGFLIFNGGRDCFAKFQNKVWMISKDGTWQYVCRTIPDLTYEEYLKLSLS